MLNRFKMYREIEKIIKECEENKRENGLGNHPRCEEARAYRDIKAVFLKYSKGAEI